MKKIKAGIIGCGAIGREIGKAIIENIPSIELIAISEIQPENINKFNQIVKKNFNSISIQKLISGTDFIIESASAKISYEIACEALSCGKNVMIMSVGGLVHDFSKIFSLAKKHGGKLYIPSGAICGIDGLKAAACSKIYSVELTTRKPPQGFSGSEYLEKNNIKIENITHETCIFNGNAEKAVLAFPKNINVSLTLSLAGIGAEKTKVKIIADPACTTNIHEICVQGDFGKFYLKTENEPSPDNPKTSYMAILSAICILKNINNPISIGN
ncbi:aspartate dehydrogenase [Candidatus Poribacteria bacterium]|nr:aspartate dehydrogenase [Candidatus Poribacteria bacterium]